MDSEFLNGVNADSDDEFGKIMDDLFAFEGEDNISLDLFTTNNAISGPSSALDHEQTNKRKADLLLNRTAKKQKIGTEYPQYTHVLAPSDGKINKTVALQRYLSTHQLPLFRHQIEAIVAALETRNILYCHEMGLGKTVMSLMVAFFDTSINNTFIFVPPALRKQWSDEIEKLAKKLKVNIEIDMDRDVDSKNKCCYIINDEKTKIHRYILKKENDPSNTKIKKFWIWSHSRKGCRRIIEKMDLHIMDEVHNSSTTKI